MPRRPGVSTLAVLQAIAAGHRYGFEIMDATDLPGGTVYPALARLERDGRLTSSWEASEAAHREKRPPRRYYRLTTAGDRLLRESMAWLRGVAAPVEDTADDPSDALREKA